ncbi:MAG: glycine cleavage system protein H [Deltaproteobacteria bacterium]|nr:glycine cleavage system protein H [Deltaproteobacteria bacterium]
MTKFLGEFQYVDFFEGKSTELLLMMVFLVAFVIFWKFVSGREEAAKGYGVWDVFGWFTMKDDVYYHKGHTWAHPEGEFIKVGIDDFAQKLIGKFEEIYVPKIGEKVDQGAIGLKVRVDSTVIDVLSPVRGEVVAVNEKVIKNPGLINTDPYGEGWVMAVKPDNFRVNLRNLLSGKLARAWLEQHVESLRERMTGNLGVVYQDGGVLVPGIARALDNENWQRVVKEYLMTD